MSEQDTGSEAIISVDDELDTLRAGIDDPMILRQQLEKEAKARRQLTARAVKAETEAKMLREDKIKAEETATSITTPQDSPVIDVNDEVVDLRLDGYSKDEVKFIQANGGRKALDDSNSFVAIAINTRREQLKAESAASQTTDTAGLSEVERKYTSEQLANMSVKELETILPKAA